jgi:putative hydrolase of the HAD superfamily
MATSRFRALYSDIGGVLGTNGWDTALRQKVCEAFDVDFVDTDKRHRLVFDSYERGFLTLEQYLTRVFFATPRAFFLGEFRDRIYAGSVPWPQNIQSLARVKKANHLKVGLISNEGQGITEHRVDKFGLRDLADFMVISHCVHMRKPDPQIWKLALDLAQVTAREAIYIDDREMFAQAAADLGFSAIHHTSLCKTEEQLRELGLLVGDQVPT